jgi:hypothetical protein
MSVSKRVLVVVAAGLLALSAAAGRAGGPGDALTANPRYEFWANFKPGANSTYLETTKMSGPGKVFAPDGVEKKTITYRLLNVDKDKAVVVTTVVEEDFLALVESAPTKITYPAKVKKGRIQAIMEEWGATDVKEETIKIGDKEIKCKVRAGTQKTEGGTVDFKIYYSDAVPGGIVKHSRTTKEGNMVVAETNITLMSFAETKEKKKKDQDKD